MHLEPETCLMGCLYSNVFKFNTKFVVMSNAFLCLLARFKGFSQEILFTGKSVEKTIVDNNKIVITLI